MAIYVLVRLHFFMLLAFLLLQISFVFFPKLFGSYVICSRTQKIQSMHQNAIGDRLPYISDSIMVINPVRLIIFRLKIISLFCCFFAFHFFFHSNSKCHARLSNFYPSTCDLCASRLIQTIRLNHVNHEAILNYVR